MPGFAQRLSHKVVDTSTYSQMMSMWFPAIKKNFYACTNRLKAESGTDYNHRAMNDCESSIQAAKCIREVNVRMGTELTEETQRRQALEAEVQQLRNQLSDVGADAREEEEAGRGRRKRTRRE